MSSAGSREFTPFDELRYVPEIKGQGRADIVFGPDMFDPVLERLTEEGINPLGDALVAAVEGGELLDLGVPTDALEKTVGEVWGEDMPPEEIRERMLAVSRRLRPELFMPSEPPGFLKRLLSSVR